MRIYTTITSLVFIMSISGCAVSTKTHLADGSQGYSISCDGADVGINMCFEKAGEVCGAQGYELLSREGQIIPSGSAAADDKGAYINYGAFNTKSIMIRCGR